MPSERVFYICSFQLLERYPSVTMWRKGEHDTKEGERKSDNVMREVGVSMGGTGGGEKDRRTESGQEMNDRVPVLARNCY